MLKCDWLLKEILSTKIVIFSYPKLLSFSVLTFIKWRLTPSYAAKDTIFWQKRPKTIVIRIIVLMTIFKSIYMAFYLNPSWACTLFRNNKQHVVLGQKRKCQRVEESGLWRIQRERWIETCEVSFKWNKCRIYVGDQLDRTQGSATRPNSSWICKYFAW
jgi:MFS superfamily sulfate permease-like transporter